MGIMLNYSDDSGGKEPIRIGDTGLDYIEQGQGEPVVLVHGSASDRRTWHWQLPRLGGRYRAIAYSRRYHWPNPPIAGGADYVMSEHVADLRRLICKLDAAPAHLIGHSYGGFVCLLLAIQQPALVRSLVLTEPPVLTLFASNQPTAGELLRLLASRPRTALAVLKFGAAGVRPATAAIERGDREQALRTFSTAVLGRRAFRSLSPARLEQARANFIEQELVGSGFPALDPAQLRAVKTRALLVTGGRSPRLFHRFADRLQELMPNVKRIEIPAASHIVHEDNPPAFGREVLTFLSGAGRDAATR
jgi:pimeloyl-ACP methyl ester carboxylesterase